MLVDTSIGEKQAKPEKTEKGKPAEVLQLAHSAEVTAVEVLNLEGKTYFITASNDKTIKIWLFTISDVKSDSDFRSGVQLICSHAAHSNDISCLSVFSPVNLNDDPVKHYVVTGSLDRSVRVFCIETLLDTQSVSAKSGKDVACCCLLKGHEDGVFDLVTLNGDAEQQKEGLIVSSTIKGEIMVWHWEAGHKHLHHDTFNFPGGDGQMFLAVCKPAAGLPYVAYAGDSSNLLLTFDPWTNKTKYNKTNKKFNSKITAMSSHTLPDGKVIVLTGHDDGKTFQFDSVTKKRLDNKNDDNDLYVDFDGDDSNDVNCISSAVIEVPSKADKAVKESVLLTAVGYGNALINVFRADAEKGAGPRAIEGRDAIVNSFFPFNLKNRSTNSDATHLIVACHDKDVRLVDIDSGAEQNLLFGKEAKFLDCYFPGDLDKSVRGGSVVGYGVSGGGTEPITLFEIFEAKKKPLTYSARDLLKDFPRDPADNEDNVQNPYVPEDTLTSIKFFNYNVAVPEANAAATAADVDKKKAKAVHLPFIITSDVSGIIQVWRWVKTAKNTTLEKLDSLDADYLRSEAQVELKVSKGEKSSEKTVKSEKSERPEDPNAPKTNEGDKSEPVSSNPNAFPIYCMEVCPKYKFIAVGTQAGFPLLVDAIIDKSEGSDNHQLYLHPKSRQIVLEDVETPEKSEKPADGSEAAAAPPAPCHSSSITCIAIYARRLDSGLPAIDIITGSKDKTVFVWDYVKRKKRLGPLAAGSVGAVTSVGVFDPVSSGFSAAGDAVIIAASADSMIRVFNFRTGALMRTLDIHQKSVLTASIVAIKGADPLLISSSNDITLKVSRTVLVLFSSYFVPSSLIPTFC